MLATLAAWLSAAPPSTDGSLGAPSIQFASSRAELSALAYADEERHAAQLSSMEPPRAQLASIAARTRITSMPALVGATSLLVKMSSGFQTGARVRINPGGATEEDHVLLAPSSFTLATPLRFPHGLGEAVLQVGVPVPVEHARASAPSVGDTLRAAWRTRSKGDMPPLATLPPPPLRAPAPTPAGGVGGDAEASAPQAAPPPPLSSPRKGEPPLVGSLTTVVRSLTFYLHGHWGVEAAAAMLLLLVATLCMAGYIVQVFFDYSLCCLGRSKGRSPGCFFRWKRRPPIELHVPK